jgi:hypothetical protein
VSVDNGEIDTLRLTPAKLVPQALLSVGAHREHDEPGRIAVYAMDNERLSFPAMPQVVDELVLDRWSGVATLERYGQQARWFVHHDHRIVLMDDLELAGFHA